MSDDEDNNKTVGSAIAIGVSIAAASILFAMRGCENKVAETVDAKNPNAISIGTMSIEFPKELISDGKAEPVDMFNAAQIAAKMHVVLNGDPKQPLYQVTVRSLTPVSEGDFDSVNEQKIWVTVEEVQAYARIANALEDVLVPRRNRDSAIAPNRFTKPTDSKIER